MAATLGLSWIGLDRLSYTRVQADARACAVRVTSDMRAHELLVAPSATPDAWLQAITSDLRLNAGCVKWALPARDATGSPSWMLSEEALRERFARLRQAEGIRLYLFEVTLDAPAPADSEDSGSEDEALMFQHDVRLSAIVPIGDFLEEVRVLRHVHVCGGTMHAPQQRVSIGEMRGIEGLRRKFLQAAEAKPHGARTELSSDLMDEIELAEQYAWSGRGPGIWVQLSKQLLVERYGTGEPTLRSLGAAVVRPSAREDPTLLRNQVVQGDWPEEEEEEAVWSVSPPVSPVSGGDSSSEPSSPPCVSVVAQQPEDEAPAESSAPSEPPIFTSLDFLRAEYGDEIPRRTTPWAAGGQKPLEWHPPFVRTEIAPGTFQTASGYEPVKEQARRTGSACFGHDLGGELKDDVQDPDTLKRKRICKKYCCLTWKEATWVLEGRHSRSFRSRLRNGTYEATNRYMYEMLLLERPSWPYGDIDCKLERNQHMVGRADEVTRTAVDFHRWMLRRLFNVEAAFEDYLIFSSDYDREQEFSGQVMQVGKISRHFLCKAVMFRTQMAQRIFANHCHVTLMDILKRAAAAEPLTPEEERWASLEITDEKGVQATILDLSVYKRDQMFRPAECTKAPDAPGRAPRYLRLADMNAWPLPEGEDTLTGRFLLSLVQRPPDGRFPDFDSEFYVDYCIRAGAEIPLAHYEVDEDGQSLRSFRIWNPGEDTAAGKRKRKRLGLNTGAATDLGAATRRSGASTTDRIRGERVDTLVEFIAKQPWAAPWAEQGRLTGACRVKPRKYQGAIVGYAVDPIPGRLGPHAKCPCLMEEGPGHGSGPVTIILDQVWHAGARARVWAWRFACFQVCSPTRAQSGESKFLTISYDVPADLLAELELQ